jgi:hypothetical protein
MEGELLHLHQIHHILPEFAGGSQQDVADELLQYLHLFLTEDQEKVALSFFIFFPKYTMDELDPIYSNTALRQQVTRCSCSAHHW